MTPPTSSVSPLGLVQTIPMAAQVTISVEVPPPVVMTSFQLIMNRKHLVTQIIITFSGVVNITEADRTTTFYLATPGTRGSFTVKNAGIIKLKNAVYNAASDKVTLTPKKAFALTKPVQLRAYVELSFGLQDALGRFINGGTDDLAVLT